MEEIARNTIIAVIVYASSQTTIRRGIALKFER